MGSYAQPSSNVPHQNVNSRPKCARYRPERNDSRKFRLPTIDGRHELWKLDPWTKLDHGVNNIILSIDNLLQLRMIQEESVIGTVATVDETGVDVIDVAVADGRGSL